MTELKTKGCYAISGEMKAKLADFAAGYATEEQVAKTIHDIYEDTGYVMDTHTAVAATVYKKYTEETGDTAKTAECEFTGTGIDIYSRVTDKTGKVKVELYDGTTRVARQIINSVSVDGDRYQIPVFSFNDLTRKTYTVKITVYKGQTYYLDGVRIYNPISEDTKVDLDKNKDTTVGDIYDKDGEANANL